MIISKDDIEKEAIETQEQYGLKPPLAPTDAAPGSLIKIDVLSRRAARGEQLYHPDDYGYGEDEGCRTWTHRGRDQRYNRS